MGARSKARRRALDILYEADMRDDDPATILRVRRERADPPITPYSAELVEGVVAHRDRIDELLGTYAQGWTLPRMPPVDRNVLRIGAYELLWCDDVPDGVAISEAVALARDLSAPETPGFVNGVLGQLLELKGQ